MASRCCFRGPAFNKADPQAFPEWIARRQENLLPLNAKVCRTYWMQTHPVGTPQAAHNLGIELPLPRLINDRFWRRSSIPNY
jgi:hypothetical protein